MTGRPAAARSVDEAEVARFSADTARWWDPSGPYAPLHRLTPVRITFVRDTACARFGRDGRALRSLAGLRILDVGCGGGILAEPLARLGGTVTAIDPGAETIAAARAHAEQSGLDIDYRAAAAEDLAEAGEAFDLVVASEVIEHVREPAAFVATLAALARPGGLVMLSTINRTAKSFALAIVGAEYILRWLPRGTHDWRRFVTLDEMEGYGRAAGLEPLASAGMMFNPLRGDWTLGADTDVNYWFAAGKGAAAAGDEAGASR